jgi:hypothetical protein
VWLIRIHFQHTNWDLLEENLKGLDISGYHHVFEEVHQDLFNLLDSILFEKKSYRHLLKYEGQQAQLLVNALQWVGNLLSRALPSSFAWRFFASTQIYKVTRRESSCRPSSDFRNVPNSFPSHSVCQAYNVVKSSSKLQMSTSSEAFMEVAMFV